MGLLGCAGQSGWYRCQSPRQVGPGGGRPRAALGLHPREWVLEHVPSLHGPPLRVLADRVQAHTPNERGQLGRLVVRHVLGQGEGQPLTGQQHARAAVSFQHVPGPGSAGLEPQGGLQREHGVAAGVDDRQRRLRVLSDVDAQHDGRSS